MRFKKFFVCLISVLFVSTSVLWSDSGYYDYDRIITLLNYIQFSTAKISISRNKGLLQSEYNEILNSIAPNSLKNDEIINQYDLLLEKIKSCELRQNELKFLEEKCAQRRKDAVFDSLAGITFVPSSDPKAMLASIGFTAASAAFNYARTVRTINRELRVREFELSQDEAKDLDMLNRTLFTTSAKVLKDATDISHLINNSDMIEFAKIAAEIELTELDKGKEVCTRNIPILEHMEGRFSEFVPYWLIRGIAYYETADVNKSLDCFRKVFELSNNIRILEKNSYIVKAAKYWNQWLLYVIKNNPDSKDSLRDTAYSYLEGIEENSGIHDLDNLKYYSYGIYLAFDDFANAKKCLDYLTQRGLEAEYGRMACHFYIYQGNKNSLEYKRAVAMESALNDFAFGGNWEKYLSSDAIKEIGNNFFIVSTKEVTSASYWDEDRKQFIGLGKPQRFYVTTTRELDSLYLYCFPNFSWNELKKHSAIRLPTAYAVITFEYFADGFLWGSLTSNNIEYCEDALLTTNSSYCEGLFSKKYKSMYVRIGDIKPLGFSETYWPDYKNKKWTWSNK